MDTTYTPFGDDCPRGPWTLADEWAAERDARLMREQLGLPEPELLLDMDDESVMHD